jgi:cytochrome c-type biogenesis protein
VTPDNIPFGLAFLAGLASFLSPCVLSLVPAYIGYLSSRAVTTTGETTENRWGTVLHGLAFVLGFSAVFVALGATASAVGALLYDFKGVLVKVGGVVVILFGLHTLGIIHIPFLEYDTRRQQAPDRRLGYLSSALMGIFFSAGWAPCVGPVLGAVLTLALNAEGVSRGVVLLSAYSMGLGIPFLLAAAGIGNISLVLRQYGKYLRYVSIATGIFLIFIGVLLLTNSLSFFARYAAFTEFQNTLDQGVVNFWYWLTGQGGS